MGKVKGAVWNHYTNDESSDIFKCLYCLSKFKRNATRQLKHLKKCKKMPINLKKKLTNVSKAQNTIDSLSESDDDSNQIEPLQQQTLQSTAPVSKIKPVNIGRYFDKVNTNLKREFIISNKKNMNTN